MEMAVRYTNTHTKSTYTGSSVKHNYIHTYTNIDQHLYSTPIKHIITESNNKNTGYPIILTQLAVIYHMNPWGEKKDAT